jgi:hypothetical protein
VSCPPSPGQLGAFCTPNLSCNYGCDGGTCNCICDCAQGQWECGGFCN